MTAEDLIHRVCAHRGVTLLQIRGPSRVASVARARHEAMWVLREATDLSLPEIVRKLGRFDHTSALYAIRKIQRVVDMDAAYGDQLRNVAMISVAAQRESVALDVAFLTLELAERKARLRDLNNRQRHRAKSRAA